GFRLWYHQFLDKIAGVTILLLVGDEEAVQRNGSPFGTAPKRQGRREGDEHRRQVTDRRSIGDVAADGSSIADLLAAEAAEHFVDLRIKAPERLTDIAQGSHGPDDKGIAPVLDAIEFSDPPK